MTVPELLALLKPLGIQPIKGRSQHFLLDESVIADMLRAAQVKNGDIVLEIGPGPGILTKALVEASVKLIAVEIDPKLCTMLREQFGQKLHLIEGDIRDHHAAEILAQAGETEASPYKLIANIPYAITSDILTMFLEEPHPPRSMTLLVQREVAERVCAKPGEMNALAVLAQTFGTPRLTRLVARGAFYPPPQVESAVLHIDVKTSAERAVWFADANQQAYFTLVRTAFSHKRKKLRNTLRAQFATDEELESVFTKSGVNPDARPEELTVEHWLALVKAKEGK